MILGEGAVSITGTTRRGLTRGPPAEPAIAEPFAWGATLKNKYRIEVLLGRGGMGVVLGARHLGLDEPVAIKIMLPEMREVPGAVERFLREARAVAKLKSPHVVRVYDVDTLPSGVPFLVMERLFGTDLATLCRNSRRLEIEEAVGYVVEAASAIAEAHGLGIVHRDLKPGNLFLAQGADGKAIIKVLDFGVSILLRPAGGEARITDVGQTLGSPTYMSPEQMLSSHDVDARTDIWALGVVLYRLIGGVAPFRADGVEKLRPLVLSAPPPPLRHLRFDVPAQLEQVILRCLEKDPAARFPTARQLVEALLPFAPSARHGRSTPTKYAVRARRSAPGPVATVEPFGATTLRFLRASRPRGARLPVIAIATVVSLGATIGLVTLPFHNGGPPNNSALSAVAEAGSSAFCPPTLATSACLEASTPPDAPVGSAAGGARGTQTAASASASPQNTPARSRSAPTVAPQRSGAMVRRAGGQPR